MIPLSFSLLFTRPLFLPLPEAEQKKKNLSSPPLPLCATLFIRLLALIPVKGKFCNAWLLNLISLILNPHSVIKVMVCVPSASLFTCAYPSFIESSRPLKPAADASLAVPFTFPLLLATVYQNCIPTLPCPQSINEECRIKQEPL